MCIYSTSCNNKKKYGPYCNKHKRNYLITNNLIIKSRFTGESKDYLKNDILNTLTDIYKKIFSNNTYTLIYQDLINKKKENKSIFQKTKWRHELNNSNNKPIIIINKPNLTGWLYSIGKIENPRIRFAKSKTWNTSLISLRKSELFIILLDTLNIINKIIKIQRFYKNYLYYSKGSGLKNINESKNHEDFYTLDSIKKIELKYFMSYKDDNDNIWCFDIRSFKQLLDKNKLNNPYSREIIPDKEINRITKVLNRLEKQNVSLVYEEDHIYSNEEQLKRIVVDIFSEMTRVGYYMDVKWFYELTSFGLKHLYKFLEDIWNYRAQLTLDVKKKIAPPNGILYSTAVNDVFRLTNIYDLRNSIITELNYIYSNCTDDGCKSLGYMYFIIGLSQVNKNCFDAHSNWITYSI